MAVVVLLVVMLLVAFTRKGSVATIAMTARRIKLHTAAPPAMVCTWFTQHCPAGYSMEEHDAASSIVILSSQPAVFTWASSTRLSSTRRGPGRAWTSGSRRSFPSTGRW
ncbi:hypothetical protein [Amycolatopsis sp. NPDC049868]|uniref:hypothetical protein n=1 Tax=Amycolatopsis sp. NPDC049868 TaxID=3363934 RepID=UPI00379D0A68